VRKSSTDVSWVTDVKNDWLVNIIGRRWRYKMTIKIEDEKALIIKESLELERNIMKLSLKEYAKEIKDFEKKHKMKSERFVEKFNTGKLGDKGEWFDWLYVYKAYHHIQDRLNSIESIVV
jgi:hypothetical protein